MINGDWTELNKAIYMHEINFEEKKIYLSPLGT